MKNITLRQIRNSLTGDPPHSNGILAKATVPTPFPGKRFPTRVAWEFEFRSNEEAVRDQAARLVNRRVRDTGRAVIEVLRDPDVRQLANQRRVRRFSYIGKPNRYRALQAQRFLQRRAGEQLVSRLEVEFDAGGILYSNTTEQGAQYGNAHVAYHPHSKGLGPIDCFAQPVHRKRVGGLTLYSYKKVMAQDEIDSFYVWYERTFKRKLKRPKGKAAAMAEAPNPGAKPEPVHPELGCSCQSIDIPNPDCPRHGISAEDFDDYEPL